jgi:nuclear transport factor 2 (NTF2) superfamily protein
MTTRPPLPPFTRETAIQKVRLAEDRIANIPGLSVADPDDHPGLSDLGL